MVEFKSPEDFKAWLETQPREVAVAFAARVAARSLPTLVRDARDAPRVFAELNLSALRAIALARAAAKYPARASDDSFRLVATIVAAAANAASASSADAAFAASAVSSEAAFAAVAAKSAAKSAARSAAALVASSSAAAVDASIFRIAADDVANAGPDRVSRPLWPPTAQAERPLYDGGPNLPAFFDGLWRELRAALLARQGEGWTVWTEWYEAWLDGREQFPRLSPQAREDLDFALCLIPDEDWKRGPAHLNALIRATIDAALTKAEIRDEELPRQTPDAAQFGPNSSGRIALSPPHLGEGLALLPDVIFFYEEARSLCGELHELGAQFLGESVFACCQRMRRAFPEAVGAAIEREVWAAGNGLRRKLSAHEAVARRDEFHPDRLEAGAVERLRAFVEAFNQLAFADPKLRARDERRPGPQETRDARVEVRLIAPVSERAAANDEATTRATADELRAQTQEARAPGEAVVDRIAVEQARDTHRNFYSSLLVSAYRAVRQVKMMAKGEGGFISKEVFSGAYKSLLPAGGGLVMASMTGHLNWDALQIVLQNLSELRQYAPLAFESAPAVPRLLDYLEANVEIEERDAGA
jgi:hypothetical protein